MSSDFSWDDRQFPKGIIGQNCIIPEYQNNGYGTKQIEKLIENFKKNDFKTISVETGDHNFFIPAKKMYEKCGFTINQKREGDLYDFIEYALKLE